MLNRDAQDLISLFYTSIMGRSQKNSETYIALLKTTNLIDSGMTNLLYINQSINLFVQEYKTPARHQGRMQVT